MNTRQRMTERFIELWDQAAEQDTAAMKAAGIEMTIEGIDNGVDYGGTTSEDLLVRLRHEFPCVPWSVHDAAIHEAMRLIAKRCAHRLRKILEQNGVKAP
jgi:hypothetical protein